MRTFRVWNLDDSRSNGEDVRAVNAKDAAEQFAARRDRRNVEFPPTSEVCVQAWTGDIAVYEVTCEPMPMYGAKLAGAPFLKLHNPEGAA